MWGMIGLSPGWIPELEEEAGEKVSWDADDAIHVGDIVAFATRNKRPVLITSENFDDTAELRVLGMAQGDRTLYLCLITGADIEHVSPTTIVGRGQAYDYGVEPRFQGCDAIIVSDLHIRRIAKKQRGRSCDKCTDYNEDIRMPANEPYMCLTCRQNRWR